jgi:uncharacterized protein (DUF433 family)
MLVADDMITLPMERAAELAEVSKRRLRYWHETRLLQPMIHRRLSQRSYVRLYNFADLTALLVTAELLGRGFSLQHVRRVVEHLRSFGIDSPLTELRFATTRKEIYFQYRDGTWSGSARPGQLVFHTIIPLEPIYSKIRDAVRRPPQAYGRIVRRRGVHGGKPVFDGTRITVQAVLNYLQHGSPPDRILEAYPDLAPADIKAAKKYATTVA